MSYPRTPITDDSSKLSLVTVLTLKISNEVIRRKHQEIQGLKISSYVLITNSVVCPEVSVKNEQTTKGRYGNLWTYIDEDDNI